MNRIVIIIMLAVSLVSASSKQLVTTEEAS